MNEELKNKIESIKNNTVLHGEIDLNVKLRIDFPNHEKLRHAFEVQELIDSATEALQNAIADYIYDDYKMSRYAVNHTEVEVSSIETKGILDAVLESFVPSRPQMGVEE